MPSKKKKYNARFPAGRIKKIMQSDEEIGKVAQAVPVIISRTLELFVESLLTKTLKITSSRNAKTLSTSHMKQCIMAEQRFDFLRELVKNIPDISVAEEAANYIEEDQHSSPEEQYPDSDTPYDLSMPSTSNRASRAANSANGDERSNAPHTQNGGGRSDAYSAPPIEQQRAHLKREAEILQRLRLAGNAPNSISPSVPSSVIMHTASFVNNPHMECTPPKLRFDPSTLQNWSQSQTSQHRQRLKHQPHSAPIIDYTPPYKLAKQQSYENPLPHAKTAIPPTPPPIVCFDFCKKPVVKIDYSNLPLSGDMAAAPQLAAALSETGGNSAASMEPVINIDLSNIVTNAAASLAPNALAPAINITCSAPRRREMSEAAPLLCNPAPSFASHPAKNLPAITNKAASSKSSFFELDEDYDNI